MAQPKGDPDRDRDFWRIADQVNVAETRSRILTLVRNGATAAQVSETLEKGDPERGIQPVYLEPKSISSLVKRYLDTVEEHDTLTVNQLRTLENERLDALWVSLNRELRNADGTINLKVVDRLTRLSERRAKMNGLDAALKHEHFLGSGLKALGLEEEHVQRGQDAFADSFIDLPDSAISEEVPDDGQAQLTP